MTEDRKKHYSHDKLKSIGNYLHRYFSKNRGAILGEASVISRKVHMEPRDSDGTVQIYLARDAGITYLKLTEADQVIHIDVLHSPAEIDILDLAGRIYNVIPVYLEAIREGLHASPPEYKRLVLNLAQAISLKTGGGEGTVLHPGPGPGPPGRKLSSHIHILAKIPYKYYGLVYCIADQAEKAVLFQGHRLRPVKKIIHNGQEEKEHNNLIRIMQSEKN